MKKTNLLYGLVLGAIVLVQAGCTSYSFTSRSTRVDQSDIYASEQVADLNVDYKKRITSTSDWQKFPNQAKQQAIYQCIMDNNVDVLVDPIFKIENRPITGYRATVTGFAATYKVGKKAIDRMVEQGYTQEQIEKYLLLNDPNFYKFYYQKDSNGNVYNIKCTNNAAPAAKVALPAPAQGKAVKAKKAKKAKKGFFKKLFAGGMEE